DILPQGPPAVLDSLTPGDDEEEEGVATPIRRVILIVRDALKTCQNPFRMFRLYPRRPTYDPDMFVSVDDLAKNTYRDSLVSAPDSKMLRDPPWPFLNKTVYNVMRWLNTGSRSKSEGEATRFVQEVIMANDFDRDDLSGFNAHHENQRADKAQLSQDGASTYLAQFTTTSVDIEVPSGQKGVPPSSFSVPNLHYR
ncbi:hypothetical protein EV360DRAFT_23193, partial [Lentinula raphanica]